MAEEKQESQQSQDQERWEARAAAWELASSSFRVPEEAQAASIAMGEWLDTARGVADALDMALPEGFGEGLPSMKEEAASSGEGASLGAAPSPYGAGAFAGGMYGSSAGAGAGGPFDFGEADLYGMPADADMSGLFGGSGFGGSGAFGSSSSSFMGDPFAAARGSSGEGPIAQTKRALRSETMRLFGDEPGASCSPREGAWRAEAEGGEGAAATDPQLEGLESFCAACGLTVPADASEPIDHVATECELLELLALHAAGELDGYGFPAAEALPGGSPQAAYARFFEEHVRAWVPRFAEAVVEQTREPFFRAAAQFLGALVEEESAA